MLRRVFGACRARAGASARALGRELVLAAWTVIDPRGMVPPRRLVYTGGGDFLATGSDYLGHLVHLAGLRPDERVLDVGCGIGRIALPLTGYLRPPGSYLGFDPVGLGIRWCSRRISAAYPGFAFLRCDVRNRRYNPRGRIDPREFRFPAVDRSRDVVCIVSVFTHMLPGDVERYLDETARVLAPGGRCLASFFLVGDLPPSGGPAVPGAPVFRHPWGTCFVSDPRNPEAAVAYRVRDVEAMFRDRGLVVARPVRFGRWTGRGDGADFQDIVVASKP